MHLKQKALDNFRYYFIYNTNQRQLYKLKNKDYSHIKLEDISEEALNKVKTNAEGLHQKNSLGWNYYSNALRREVIQTFELAICALTSQFKQIDYLEIGSAQGLSMSLIASILKTKGLLNQLVSVDPYFEGGYQEGLNGIWKRNNYVNITKNSKDIAFELYKLLEINVELLEMTSMSGLQSLIQANRKFHLIYIDGSHEGLNPAIDFGFSCSLLHPGGVIMFDDPFWPDVAIIKTLCDTYCHKIHECWKVAAYKIVSNANS